MERKSCDPGQAQTLKTQVNIVGFGRLAQYSWHFEDELGPTGFIIQLLKSATLVDDITGFYCTGT